MNIQLGFDLKFWNELDLNKESAPALRFKMR